MQSGIPYRVIGALGYYERKEIKDMVSYLRFMSNPHDSFSLERIINVPRSYRSFPSSIGYSRQLFTIVLQLEESET